MLSIVDVRGYLTRDFFVAVRRNVDEDRLRAGDRFRRIRRDAGGCPDAADLAT